MININDPVQAAKLFSDLDPVEDPLGRQALKQIDFKGLGLFCPNKEYHSAKEATINLQRNRNRVSQLLNSTKEKQIQNFKNILSSVVKEDHEITLMPQIRMNCAASTAHKSTYQSRNDIDFSSQNVKRVPIAKYLSEHRKETNLHQSDIKSTSVTSGVFEPASAHHQFNKNSTQIKKIYTSIFDGVRRKSRYVASEIPVAVTTGAERVVPFAQI